MTPKTSLKALPAVVAVLLAASPALATGAMVRHSGSIVSHDAKHGTITIAEMGPWHGPTTRAARREFHLAPNTKVELVTRGGESGALRSEFIEQSMRADSIRPGDYVTVTLRHEARKAVVSDVEVIRPNGMGASLHASKH